MSTSERRVCVCIHHVSMYYVSTFLCVSKNKPKCVCVYTSVCLYLPIKERVCVCVCLNVYVFENRRVCMYVSDCMWMYLRVIVCVYIHVLVCVRFMSENSCTCVCGWVYMYVSENRYVVCACIHSHVFPPCIKHILIYILLLPPLLYHKSPRHLCAVSPSPENVCV